MHKHNNKSFSPELDEQCDDVGKQYAKEILRDVCHAIHLGTNVGEQNGSFSDGFWDDQYRTPNGEVVIIEAEIKDVKRKGWWGKDHAKNNDGRPFKYTTMDIAERKTKNLADFFVVVDPTGTYAWMANGEVVRQAKKEWKCTTYEPNGGLYLRPSCSKGSFFHWVDGKWKIWIC